MFRYKKSRNQKNKGEAKIITCWHCTGEFQVPQTTTKYRCPRCQKINASSSGNEMGMVKSASATKNIFKFDGMSQNVTKSGNVLNQWPSSSFSSVRSLSSSSSWGRSNKRAVLCGVTYRRKRYRLKGTVNDVANMKQLLLKVFDFPAECIHELTEDKENQSLVPTKKNILRELKWLVEGCQNGDSLVFYFSGHGIQQPDSDDDEKDGMDESLCPVDFLQEGPILDDEMNSILVWPLKDGVTLHVIVDACHSGTVLDLSYVYDPQKSTWKSNMPIISKEAPRKHPNGGRAICISACEDYQLAVDTTAFRGKGVNGLMTFILTKVLKHNPAITYFGLIELMRKEIQDIMSKNNNPPSFFKHIFHRPKIEQDVVISSSEQFDLSQTIFTL